MQSDTPMHEKTLNLSLYHPICHPICHQPNALYASRLSRFGDRVTDIFAKTWFSVNLGGNGLLQSLTNYLIIKALVNEKNAACGTSAWTICSLTASP